MPNAPRSEQVLLRLKTQASAMPGSMLIGRVGQEFSPGNRPPREVEPRVSGWEGGRAPQQPDFAVWLQERHRAELNGSERGRGRSFRARFVVITTALQSRVTHRATAPADAPAPVW